MFIQVEFAGKAWWLTCSVDGIDICSFHCASNSIQEAFRPSSVR